MNMPLKSEEIKQKESTQEYFARREIWEKKPHIRLVYERWVNKMRPFLPQQGPLLEVGSGSGLLRDFIPDVILSEMVDLPWIDRVVDCAHMPFEDGALGGVIGFDLLHHLEDSHSFLEETARVLRPGGRAVFIEPYVTFFSFFGYKALHHESIYFKDYHPNKEKKDPWEGNTALANLVFHRDLKNWALLHPSLKIVRRELFSFFDFTCAAGFKPYAYVPYRIFRHLIKIDNCLTWLMPLIAFRIFVVLEKAPVEKN
jgi:SAM-dependent methyltransferase